MLASLESLCVQCVAKNLGKFERFERCTEDEGDPRYCLSPFEVLPSSVIKSVFEAVKGTKGTTRQADHLGLLITKKLEALDLLFFSDLSEDTAFHLLCLAALHRSPLKILQFSFPNISYHSLQDILPAFPNLHILDVSDTECVNDSFLALVASSCPHLRSLNVASCVDVTDVGIQRLCNSIHGSSGRGICHSLVILGIQLTKVTAQGARLALENLVNLEELRWNSTVQVVAEMYQSGERRSLSLRKLVCARNLRNFLGPNSLAEAIHLCPSIAYLDTGAYKPSSEDLGALLSLDSLESLMLEDASRISFDEDLLPILEKLGHKSLSFLSLTNIEEVNIGAIVEHCSMLGSLYIRRVRRFTQSHPRQLKPSPGHLPRLHILDISEGGDEGSVDSRFVPYSSQASSTDLALLLGSAPTLWMLKLSGMDNLSDGTFEEAIAQHGFPRLEILSLSKCRNVTGNVVDLLLELEHLPKYVEIERFKYLGDDSHIAGQEIFTPFHAPWTEKLARKNMGPTRALIRYCECDP